MDIAFHWLRSQAWPNKCLIKKARIRTRKQSSKLESQGTAFCGTAKRWYCRNLLAPRTQQEPHAKTTRTHSSSFLPRHSSIRPVTEYTRNRKFSRISNSHCESGARLCLSDQPQWVACTKVLGGSKIHAR